VLVMGTGSPGRVWSLRQVPALAAAGFQVVTFDNRGVPPHPVPLAPFTLADMVEDTAALVEHLGAGPVALVGTSLGARIVQELVLARPDLVTRAVAMAAHARLGPLQVLANRAERELHDEAVTLPRSHHAVVTALSNLAPATLRDDAATRDWLELFEMSSGTPDAGTRAQLDAALPGDRRQAYAAIDRPLLALAFAEDRRIPPHLTREVADAVPGARYAEIADAGHFGYLERPAETNQAVLDFLTDEKERA
jgi:pimeloyl-ACP methyl ester carboxylesterase